MKEQKFKIGDRVVVTKQFDAAKVGMKGVVKFFNCRGNCAVEFDTPFKCAHSCGGYCEADRGHWVSPDNLKLDSGDKIVVYTEGKTVTARLYENTTVRKEATAICSPDDTFDFEIGAKLAIERLFEKPKRDTDFKPGDIIRIRSWEDMEEEFGLDEDGCIACKFTFTKEMRPLCGKVFAIKSNECRKGRTGDGKSFELFNHPYAKEGFKRSISTDMIEKVDLSELSK